MPKNRKVPVKLFVASGILCFIVVRMWTTPSVDAMPSAPPVRVVAGSRLTAALARGVALEVLGNSIRSVTFSADGRVVASMVWDYVQVWDAATGSRHCSIPLEFDASRRRIPLSMALSPDGTHLAVGFWDAHVEVWDVLTGKRRATLAGTTRRLNTTLVVTQDWHAVAFSPDGRTLATGLEDETVKLWDVATFQEKSALKGHRTPLCSVAFSPDGSTLASSGNDGQHGEIKLWDLANGRERPEFPENVPVCYSLAFSPDGMTLASGMVGVIKLWDVATRKEKNSLLLKRSETLIWPTPTDLVFSPDGALLASIGSDSDETVPEIARLPMV